MAKMVKCPYCEEKFDRETIKCTKVKNRYYHVDCLAKHTKKQQAEKVERANKKANGDTSEQHRRNLIGYVMELRDVDRLNGMVFKQIKDLHEQGFSYIGMQSTLKYFHEIKGNPIIGTGIGIVPFVYDEARDWYIKKSKASKHFEELVKNGMKEITTEKKVRVRTQKLETRIKNKIDISSL